MLFMCKYSLMAHFLSFQLNLSAFVPATKPSHSIPYPHKHTNSPKHWHVRQQLLIMGLEQIFRCNRSFSVNLHIKRLYIETNVVTSWFRYLCEMLCINSQMSRLTLRPHQNVPRSTIHMNENIDITITNSLSFLSLAR